MTGEHPAGPTGRPDPGTGRVGIVVREARPDEYDRIGELTVTAYREAGENDEPYYPTLRAVAARAADVPVLVAVDAADDAVLGAVAFVPGPGPWAEIDRPDAASFRMLVVAPEAQRRGVGRALVEACVTRARALGRRELHVVTRPFMATAQRLYTSIGFERDPDSDWQFAPGEWLLGYRLEL